MILPGCRLLLGAALLGAGAAAPAGAGAPASELTLAESLCAGYARIETVSARVRKTSEADGKTATLLSQVYYQRPDRMHVENIAPLRRRIIADGARFYYHVEGMKQGFACPLDRLEGEWKLNQQSVPGSPMEHLLRLKGVAEETLPAMPEHPVRRGYRADKVYVVLSCDPQGRLARLEFFTAADRQQQTARIEYSEFQEAGAGVWLAALHQGRVTLGGRTVSETRRFDALVVNQPLAAGLFEAAPYFPQVEWVDSFEALLKSAGAQERR